MFRGRAAGSWGRNFSSLPPAVSPLCPLCDVLVLSRPPLCGVGSLGNDIYPPPPPLPLKYGASGEICVRHGFGNQQVGKKSLFIIFKAASYRLIFNWWRKGTTPFLYIKALSERPVEYVIADNNSCGKMLVSHASPWDHTNGLGSKPLSPETAINCAQPATELRDSNLTLL